jgi:hypothetical protein
VEEHFVFWPDTGSDTASALWLCFFFKWISKSDTASALWLCLFQMDFQVSNDLNRLSDTASALCLFQMDFQASNNVA